MSMMLPSADKRSAWFVNFGAKQTNSATTRPSLAKPPALRLFCFPFAGGSAAIYKDWAKSFGVDNGVEVCAVQLPGRGARMNEPLIDNSDLLIEQLLTEITPLLDVPYAFFGHSMGAHVAWELTRALRVANLPQPKLLIVSARAAPQVKRKYEPIHDLPEAEFIREIGKLKGTPEEILRNPELMEIVSPILRADFKVIETWQYRSQTPLTVPIVALRGEHDKGVNKEANSAWQQQTSIELIERELPGGHFFIVAAQQLVLAEVKNALNQFILKPKINPRVTALI